MTQIEALAAIDALEGEARPADFDAVVIAAVIAAGLAIIEPVSGCIGLTDAGAEAVYA